MYHPWPGYNKKESKMYCCPDCGLSFEEGDYRLEERTHDGLFRCPECSRPLDFDDEDDPENT
jgi:DNA-directed RNA polymerase subunit RPC12/RpoP